MGKPSDSALRNQNRMVLIVLQDVMNPSTLEKMHLMADGLSGNGVCVKVFRLCHTQKSRDEFIFQYGEHQRYQQDMGPIGTKYDGKCKLNRAANKLRLCGILFYKLFVEFIRQKVTAVIIPRDYLIIILPVLLLKSVFKFNVIANVMEYSPCQPSFSSSYDLRKSWKLICKHSDKFITISQFLEEIFIKKGPTLYLPALVNVNASPKPKCQNVGFDIRYFSSCHSHNKQCKAYPVLLYTCSAAYVDLLEFCLESLATIQNKNFIFIITGTYHSDEKDRLDYRIKQLGLKNKVCFTGFLEEAELMSLQKRSTALLIPLLDSPRHNARFPQKIMQYILLRKAIASTGVGEIKNIFTHNLNAFIDVTVTPRGYGEIISKILEDNDKVAAVANNAQGLISKEFNHIRWGRKLADFI
jgi:glycosyltransferase involved in cell wall biosynthesis